MSIIDKMAEAIYNTQLAKDLHVYDEYLLDYCKAMAQAAWDIVKAEMLRDNVVMEARYAFDAAYWKDDATIAKSIEAALTAAIKKLEEWK